MLQQKQQKSGIAESGKILFSVNKENLIIVSILKISQQYRRNLIFEDNYFHKNILDEELSPAQNYGTEETIIKESKCDVRFPVMR